MADNKKELTTSPFRTPRKGRGRPHKLTAQVVDKICAGIAEGNYAETCAAGAGVSRRSVTAWLEKAREIYEKLEQGRMKEADLTEIEQNLIALLLAVEDALDVTEARHIGIINRAAQKSWQAASWLLERKFPEKFGTGTRRIEHHGQIDVTYTEFVLMDDRKTMKRCDTGEIMPVDNKLFNNVDADPVLVQAERVDDEQV